uniref:microtubule-associated proteins 1A/1B light chain 3C-like isoform X1 n=1 Tax=Styela clava TaxID=7725 RepID=UPI001939E626|nr:microtubule-associated proteins 1A/1B light chain 3C-like isoform X1 [Styela clava]
MCTRFLLIVFWYLLQILDIIFLEKKRLHRILHMAPTNGNAAQDAKNEYKYIPFKERKSLATRKAELKGIREKFPTKMPIIVERYKKEKYLPFLDKTKYLVPQELTMSQFATIIRNRMCVGSSQAVYFTVNKRHMPNMSMTISEIYQDNVDEDGFLYMTYASQEMFG